MYKKAIIFVTLFLFFGMHLVNAGELKKTGDNQKEVSEEIILLIPKIEIKEIESGKAMPCGPGSIVGQQFEAIIKSFEEISLKDIIRRFETYGIDTIGIWIAGKGEENILILSLQANTGIKLILKPKKAEY